MHDGLSKGFAARLGVMLRSSLINHKHYGLWCEDIIESEEQPPDWVLELAWTAYQPEAIKIVEAYAFSDPFLDFGVWSLNDFYLACLFVRYRMRHISWATFLLSAGAHSDGNECCLDCEYFYARLNELEDHGYSMDVERRQSGRVHGELEGLIGECECLYRYFEDYFQRYITKEKWKGGD